MVVKADKKLLTVSFPDGRDGRAFTLKVLIYKVPLYGVALFSFCFLLAAYSIVKSTARKNDTNIYIIFLIIITVK